MINAVIVDDEMPALDVLKFMLEKSGQISVVGAFISAKVALAEIRNLKPDVVFLDIEMSEMTGLTIAEKIVDIGVDVQVIFVTAYNKYACEAFRVNAIDYILKPFSSDDIAHAISRLQKLIPLPVKSLSKIPDDHGRIYCFGALSVYGVGCENAVKWRTKKAEELFAFMLHNLNIKVPKWKITEVLWPEYETDNINVNLHTTVYQIKKTLLAAKIKFNFTFENGMYMLELPEAYIDTTVFEANTDADITFTADSIDICNETLELYKGNYLEGNEYLWTQNKVDEYSKRYLNLVSGLAGYYMDKSDYRVAEKILLNALTIIPLDCGLNEMMLKLYFVKKDKVLLVKHYKKIQELYLNELDIEPNTVMKNLLTNAFLL